MAELHERLLARRDEIEEAILTRAYSVSDPSEVEDPTYLEGLRAAVRAAVDYGITAVHSSERNPPLIPPALLVQARVAAHSGVTLDTVLRRYFAGYALLGDFLIEEAEALGLRGVELKRLLRRQSALFDRVVTAISEEHSRDGPKNLETGERRRLELVKHLLDGEPLDTEDLDYRLAVDHVGLVARGRGASEVLTALGNATGNRLLVVSPTEEEMWGWLGSRNSLDLDRVERVAKSALAPGSHLAIGEQGSGLGGWRFSHRQAKAALGIAVRGREPVVRYADVALLAALAQDELLATSLRRIYLEPLERDGDEVLCRTLRAYLAAERNASSAASALGVRRHTVMRRLRTVEERLGRPLHKCMAEVETALRLQTLTQAGR